MIGFKEEFSKDRQLIVLTGNIGAGKSTLISNVLDRDKHIVVCKDSLRYMFGGGDYLFNSSFEEDLNIIERAILSVVLLKGYNVVIDETNVTAKIRRKYLTFAKFHEYTLRSIELPRLSKEDSLERRMKNSRGYSIEEWGIVWDKFNDEYEKPLYSEGFDYITDMNEPMSE